jgi:hypothetical protein
MSKGDAGKSRTYIPTATTFFRFNAAVAVSVVSRGQGILTSVRPRGKTHTHTHTFQTDEDVDEMGAGFYLLPAPPMVYASDIILPETSNNNLDVAAQEHLKQIYFQLLERLDAFD